MEKKAQIKILFVLGLIFISALALSFANGVFASGENYIIEGDSVYIDDSKVKINITPHTSNQPVIELTSKVYSGEIDIVAGFNTSEIRPTSARYNPRVETVQKNYTCEYDFNYTTSPEKYFWCYKTEIVPIYDNSTNETLGYENQTQIVFEHFFETGNIPEATAYWTEQKTVWTDVSGEFNKVTHDFLDYDTWYYKKGFNVQAGETYKLQLFLRPVRLDTPSHKYFFGIKPSGETLQEAIANGHFYYIDPWTESLDDGLVAYYKLDETSGTTAEDSHGTNDGTANNARVFTTEATGIINTGADFTGGDDDVDLGTTTAVLGSNPDEWSYNIWFKTTTTADEHIMGAYAGVGVAHPGVITTATDYDINAYVYDGSSSPGITKEGTYNDGEWHMATLTVSKTENNFTLYVDGSYADSAVLPSDTADYTGTNHLYLGRWSVSGFFNGIVDEVGIWSRALTSDEVSDLYNSGDGISYGDYGETNCWTETTGKIIIPPGCQYYTNVKEGIFPS